MHIYIPIVCKPQDLHNDGQLSAIGHTVIIYMVIGMQFPKQNKTEKKIESNQFKWLQISNVGEIEY